jgi:hypothetical protein
MGNRQNTDDKSQVKQASKDENIARIRELEDIVVVMNTEAGRRFIWRILVETGKDTCNFTGNSFVYYNEGRRYIGVWTEKELKEASIELYFLMLKEAHGINN